MPTCTRCFGEGYETYEEDGRMVTDACYHCGTTGKIDEETFYHDQLGEVATAMAVAHVQEYKKFRNEDPDGEGFEFCAAENMMSPWDYERCLVYDHVDVFGQRLAALSASEKRAYVDKLIAGEKIEPIYEGVE